MTATPTGDAETIEGLRAEIARLTSDRQYIVGWNDGFAHVNGPLRFPTMLRKMWSGGEVQAWLDAQRIEAAREAAADEGSALARAEARALRAESQVAEAMGALEFYADAERYHSRLVTMECGCCTYDDLAEVGPDGDTGERARSTLANLETKETDDV